ncbi:MAG: D-alanyl-D-alanine carboxypeptidase [Muribaculaceae bacterium]|nr:D-alanyl-D-alanine carboxypeptidase [Muribaculaceae bacterium]
MKKIVLVFALLTMAASFSFAASPLQTFLRNRAVDEDATAVLIQDLATGKTLVSHNAGKSLLPASVMKTVTIAALLSEEGTDRRFHTPVYLDGKVKGDVLDGDLVIVGSGDPTLGADCEPASADISQEILEALRKRGISRITGEIRVDTSLYKGPACPPSWATADLLEAYGTGSHALNYRRNARGSHAVTNPETVFLAHLSNTLHNAGIETGGRAKAGSTGVRDSRHSELLIDHTSDRYEEVMRSCMMRSDNLFAENMLRAFSLCRGKEGSTSAAANEMQNYWKGKGMPCDGVTVIDGSGLSRSNRVTANFINSILRHMGDNEAYASFMPLAGAEGTLKSFLKDTPLEAYVAMKTGSMKGIQCYAGYMLDEKFAPTHSIVILMNGIGKRSEAQRAAEELLMETFQ